MLLHEAVEQAIAEEYVRLQGSTLQQLLEAAGIQQQGLNASIDAIAQQAYAAWQAAGNQAAHHLYVTLRVTDPERTLESVLRQPDVQAALRRPFDYATDATREAISEAWQEGAARGFQAANADLATMDLDPADPSPLNQDILNQLLDDATANGAAAYQRFRDSITSTDPDAVREAIRNVTQTQALRARAGTDVAGTSAFHDAERLAYDQGGVNDWVWVTSFSAATCRFCAALHGTRRRLDQTYPFDASLPWWGDHLGPPRHPNCRCRLVPYLRVFEEEGGPTLQSMRDAGRRLWDQLRS